MAALRLARWARRILIVFLGAFIGIQFVPVERTNPPSRAIDSLHAKTPPEIKAILDRSCRDCHSNETHWPWYSYVAPASWLVTKDVTHGREHLNYSEWTSIDSDEQDKFLGGMCSLTQRGRMPLPAYLWIHRDAKLSASDIAAICAWSEKMRDTLQ
jgi:hypothetical protein